MTPPKDTTQRGFGIYASFRDTDNAMVRLIESSRAVITDDDEGGPWIRIYVDGGNAGPNEGHSHLNVEQVRTVRDALTTWLVDIGEDDG